METKHLHSTFFVLSGIAGLLGFLDIMAPMEWLRVVDEHFYLVFWSCPAFLLLGIISFYGFRKRNAIQNKNLNVNTTSRILSIAGVTLSLIFIGLIAFLFYAFNNM